MKAVHNTALRLTRHAEDARDLVQETYLRAYRTFENFRPGTNCKAWLFKILYSIFINRYHREQRIPKSISVHELDEKFHRALASEERADRLSAPQWSDAEVKRALDELPENFRSAVLLVDVEELSYEETAAALNCPVGTVRSRLFRARKLLYILLQDYARRAGYGKGDSSKE